MTAPEYERVVICGPQSLFDNFRERLTRNQSAVRVRPYLGRLGRRLMGKLEESSELNAADELVRSWNSFSSEIASAYMKTCGYPAESSKKILVDILKSHSNGRRLSILDLGCGNGQLYEYFKEQKFSCGYTGVDFSGPLLEAARTALKDDPNARFIQDDVDQLSNVEGQYDFAVYSHVIEMIASPESSLLKARKLTKGTIIRFFEPPEFENDTIELRHMEVGDGKEVPYIRRKMSRDYYWLILHKMGCTHIDIYRDKYSKDQVHVLHYNS